MRLPRPTQALALAVTLSSSAAQEENIAVGKDNNHDTQCCSLALNSSPRANDGQYLKEMTAMVLGFHGMPTRRQMLLSSIQNTAM